MRTKNLSSAENACKIASQIMELKDICKRLNIGITVSEIVSRGDDLIT